MKNIIMLVLLYTLSTDVALADCDMTRFRWDCETPMKLRPSQTVHSLVYCGMTFGYLTPREYEVLSRYNRRDINMVLKADGETLEMPCIPADKYVH